VSEYTLSGGPWDGRVITMGHPHPTVQAARYDAWNSYVDTYTWTDGGYRFRESVTQGPSPIPPPIHGPQRPRPEFTPTPLLTPDELTQILEDGRCHCGHLAVFHSYDSGYGYSCDVDGCECRD
jgi:hypothetical protein